MVANASELEFAILDPLICLAPGLFRSLQDKKGCRGTSFSINYHEYKISGPEILCANDLHVLQTLAALLAKTENGNILSADTSSKVGKTLRNQMQLHGSSVSEDLLVMIGLKKLRFMRYLGLSNGGPQQKEMMKSLDRMSLVTISEVGEGRQVDSFRLLSYSVDAETGYLAIALNPRLTKCIRRIKKQYCHIDLNAARGLKDAARILQQHLCAFLNPSKNRTLTFDSLCSYIWPNVTGEQETSDGAIRNRYTLLRKSLKELESIGWVVVVHHHKAVLTMPKKGAIKDAAMVVEQQIDEDVEPQTINQPEPANDDALVVESTALVAETHTNSASEEDAFFEMVSSLDEDEEVTVNDHYEYEDYDDLPEFVRNSVGIEFVPLMMVNNS